MQALPRDGKPVTAWGSRDKAFKDIAVGIRKAAEELLRAPEASTPGHATAVTVSSARPRVQLYRSPIRDARDLKLFGPRLEIAIGLPILRSSADFKMSGSGSPVRMRALIDLGASRTVLTPAAVARAGLHQVGATTLARVGGLEENVKVYTASMAFPRSQLTTIEVMEVVSCELAYPLVHCLLGRDVVSRWVFTYDGPLGEWEIREDGAEWVEPPEGFR